MASNGVARSPPLDDSLYTFVKAIQLATNATFSMLSGEDGLEGPGQRPEYYITAYIRPAGAKELIIFIWENAFALVGR